MPQTRKATVMSLCSRRCRAAGVNVTQQPVLRSQFDDGGTPTPHSTPSVMNGVPVNARRTQRESER